MSGYHDAPISSSKQARARIDPQDMEGGFSGLWECATCVYQNIVR